MNTNITSVIEHARLIATAAHYGQFRRDGVTPYITHSEAVAAAVDDVLKPIAWLHDVCEDTWICGGLLYDAGLPLYVCNAVLLLTRPKGGSYEGYIKRMLHEPQAVIVKLADIHHNLSCDPSQQSIEKSKWALPMLEAALIKNKETCHSQP